MNTNDAVAVLREALAFYADSSRWSEFASDERDAAYDHNIGSDFGTDQGKRAVEALAATDSAATVAKDTATLASDIFDYIYARVLNHDKAAIIAGVQALLATPKPEASAATQQAGDLTYCWLVELRPAFAHHPAFPATYYAGWMNGPMDAAKTQDPCASPRFTRKADAEQVAKQLGGTLSCEWKAVEHGFAAPISEDTDRTANAGPVGDRFGIERMIDSAPLPTFPTAPVSDGDAMPFDLPTRLRDMVQKLRRTPQPIADVVPMLQQAADALDSRAARTVTGSGGSIGEDLKFRRLAYQWQHELGDAKDFDVLVAYIDARTARNAGVAAPDTSARDAVSLLAEVMQDDIGMPYMLGSELYERDAAFLAKSKGQS